MSVVIKPKQFLDPLEIRQNLGISQEGLSVLLKVSAKTVSRWEKDKRQPRDGDILQKLAKLKEIQELGLMVYTKEGLNDFLQTPLPIFGGRSGFDLLQLGDYEAVIGALAADLEGTGF